jgi:hypothetical protein
VVAQDALVTLSHTYRITQYDPADRDPSGAYVGDVDSVSDKGPLEAAYLDAVEAFARELGVTHLEVRDPSVPDPDDLDGQQFPAGDPSFPDAALLEIFGEDRTKFFDGAVVDIPATRVLVRGMLRDDWEVAPWWCRLESPDMTVYVGYDVYMFITTSSRCPRAEAATTAAGLFPEYSPGRVSPNTPDEAEEERWRSMHTPIDDTFWARVDALVHEHGAVLLEEDAAWSRWHRVTAEEPRPELRPRCRVRVWPDLATDVSDALAHVDEDDPDDIHGTIIWQGPDGHVHVEALWADAAETVRATVSGATRASWRSDYLQDMHPLIEAVMPDGDGVIRGRWEPLQSSQGTG